MGYLMPNPVHTYIRTFIHTHMYNCLFHVPVFSIPKQGRDAYTFFRFLSILFRGLPGQQSPQFCKFSDYYSLIRVFHISVS